jgi:hypothetical protein
MKVRLLVLEAFHWTADAVGHQCLEKWDNCGGQYGDAIGFRQTPGSWTLSGGLDSQGNGR